MGFEGAAFRNPLRSKESKWHFSNSKGDRSRAFSSPQPEGAPSPMTNVGNWLDSQSLSQLAEEPSHDDSPRQSCSTSPVTKVDSHGSVSQFGSDTASIRTSSSSISLMNGASQTKFRSLAEQIAQDDREERAKQHLRRIMEAEEARVAQFEMVDSEREIEIEKISPAANIDQDRALPNALRLSFEPQKEDWDFHEMFLGMKLNSADRPPDYDASNASYNIDNNLGQPLDKLGKESSVHTVTIAGEEKQAELHSEPHLSSPPTQEPEKSENQQTASSDIEIPPPMKPEEALQSLETNKNLFQEASGAQDDTRQNATVDSPPNTLTANSPPMQSTSSHAPVAPDSPTAAPTPTLPSSSEEDTLFQDLNRLRMSTSIRQSISLKPEDPLEHQPQPAPIALQYPFSNFLAPSRGPSPAPVFATAAPPRPPRLPTMPVYKEILTPPIPSHAVELSTSRSVQYKVRAPRADEKYRRNRQHSDISAYNTLPDEAYPLMQPEPRFEAPPCEEDLRHLARSRAPRRSIKVPGPKSGAQRSGSVEPDMDPRTGFVYRGH